MDEQLSILYEPVRLNGLELKNRLVMAPMHTKFASESGEVTDRLISYLAERARGGVGLIVLENTCIDWVYGRPMGNPVSIHDDMCRSGLSNIPLAVQPLRRQDRDPATAHRPPERALQYSRRPAAGGSLRRAVESRRGPAAGPCRRRRSKRSSRCSWRGRDGPAKRASTGSSCTAPTAIC